TESNVSPSRARLQRRRLRDVPRRGLLPGRAGLPHLARAFRSGGRGPVPGGCGPSASVAAARVGGGPFVPWLAARRPAVPLGSGRAVRTARHGDVVAFPRVVHGFGPDRPDVLPPRGTVRCAACAVPAAVGRP